MTGVQTCALPICDLVCEFVHGAPYLDLLLQHRRDARDAQAKSSGAAGPNVRPLSALKPDVVPGDELHRAYQAPNGVA